MQVLKPSRSRAVPQEPLMPKAASRMRSPLGALVVPLPVGTNLGLLPLLWMVVSGRLLTTRGAVIPGLDACGLSRRAVRRAWAALGTGDWTSERLLAQWARLVAGEGRWQTRSPGGYQPVPVDVTGVWAPPLRAFPTTHYHAEAGKALPAIPVGIVARVGEVGGQRVAPPLALASAPAGDPSPHGHARALVGTAVRDFDPDDALVLAAGFPLALLQEAGATRYVVRLAKNATFRRATPPPYRGRGRPPARGLQVRPLPRVYKGRLHVATAPDEEVHWEEGHVRLRAAI